MTGALTLFIFLSPDITYQNFWQMFLFCLGPICLFKEPSLLKGAYIGSIAPHIGGSVSLRGPISNTRFLLLPEDAL